MTDALASKIVAPDTLAEERLINQFFSEEPTSGDVNEGNLLSLNTIRKYMDQPQLRVRLLLKFKKLNLNI